MKILENKYPIGSIKGQKTPGRYIDGYLYDNLKILAKNIIKDHTWLGILSSSTLEVGTGKSTISQQIAEAYTSLVNEYHKLNLEFTIDNICWRPKELIERSFKVPRYSCIILDEWEDATYWSELGVTLRKFFRKCRQLNLFILIIIPNYFQLPQNYAVSRSVFFIDVYFDGEFERGNFKFYNFENKKNLYIKGKKFQDYHAVMPNFTGKFTDGYAVDEKIYRDAKLKDMIDSEKEEEQKKPKLIERDIKAKMFKQIYEHFKGKISQEELANSIGINRRTAWVWMNELTKNENSKNEICDFGSKYNINLINNDDKLINVNC